MFIYQIYRESCFIISIFIQSIVIWYNYLVISDISLFVDSNNDYLFRSLFQCYPPLIIYWQSISIIATISAFQALLKFSSALFPLSPSWSPPPTTTLSSQMIFIVVLMVEQNLSHLNPDHHLLNLELFNWINKCKKRIIAPELTSFQNYPISCHVSTEICFYFKTKKKPNTVSQKRNRQDSL